jgi:hypothetical protein
MAYTYDPLDLITSTASGRLNVVRLLVGDNDLSAQQMQNEEIAFALSENGDNAYFSAAFCARLLASKYARMVNTQLDGALEAEYSDRVKQYTILAIQLSELGKKMGGRNMGVSAGGISRTAMNLANQDTDRPRPAFNVGQFDNLSQAGYFPEQD